MSDGEYWTAEPDRPHQKFGNEYLLVPLTEQTFDRYCRRLCAGSFAQLGHKVDGMYLLLIRQGDVPIHLFDREIIRIWIFSPHNVLRAEGKTCLPELTGWSGGDLLRLPNCGRRTAAEILEAAGVSLSAEILEAVQRNSGTKGFYAAVIGPIDCKHRTPPADGAPSVSS